MVESYAFHLGGADGPGLTLARELIRDGADTRAGRLHAVQRRDHGGHRRALAHRRAHGQGRPRARAAARLRSFHDLPEGTLGRAYVEFCDRNNLTLPGDNPLQPAVFVAHDMTHVITGYEPTGAGELAWGRSRSR